MINMMEEELRESFCEYRQGLNDISSCKEVPVFSRSVDLVEYNLSTKELTAIEFKIADWKRALNQLKCIEGCFDYLVLCIPRPKTEKCKINIVETCNSLGIGLYLWDKQTHYFSHECEAKIQKGIWHVQKDSIIEYLSETELFV